MPVISAKSISWLGIRTSEFRETVAFFTEMIGCTVEHEEEGCAILRFPSGDSVEIFDTRSPYNTHFTGSPVAEFYVDDVADAQRRLEAVGIKFFTPPKSVRGYSWSHFKAPDGNIYGLVSGNYAPKKFFFEEQRHEYHISTDKTKLDVRVIFDFLSVSYWANQRSLETVKKSIENSLCFGIYFHDEQIGFCRVVSDYATFAYVADVFVLENHRGKGLSKWLMGCVLNHPELQGLRRWTLATKDAHGLYEQSGFKPLWWPERWMEKFDEKA